MGGGNSKSTTNNIGIPVEKRYDTTYLTGLLRVLVTEREQGTQAATNKCKTNDIRMAIAACDALQNVSDSYAYSEEAIAAGSIAALFRLLPVTREERETSKQLAQQDTIPTTTGVQVEHNCPDCNCLQEVELAVACAHTLRYMLEESSAPQLFRKALDPLLPGGQGSWTFCNREKWCSVADESFETLRLCLEKIDVLVIAES